MTKTTWTHFPAGEHGFFRAPVLLAGRREAVLIDGGFTLPDGRAVAEAIAASGKTLTTVYVSQSDPDYYFGLGPIKAAFPEAAIVAAPATVAAIRASMQKKLDVWGPKLGDNGPQQVADLALPEASSGARSPSTATPSRSSRPTGWPTGATCGCRRSAPCSAACWCSPGCTCGPRTPPNREQRAAWLANLDLIAARRPAVVVPGHMAVGAATDASAHRATPGPISWPSRRSWPEAADSAALVAAMTRRYPGAGMGVALDIGAKVAKGEMTWG